MRELSKLGSLRAGAVAAVAGLVLGGAGSALSDQGGSGSRANGDSATHVVTAASRGASTPSDSHPSTSSPAPAPAPALTPTISPTTPTLQASPPSKPKPQPPRSQPQLSGMLGGGAVFPARTLELWPPSPVFLSTNRVHVTENGQAVSGLQVTPLTQAGPGDFGVILVIDQNVSMSGQPLSQVLAAARALAVQRTGNQEFGVVTFAGRSTTAVALTTDPQAITQGLSSTPSTASGSQILPALSLAYQELAQARVAAGAVILLADSADLSSAGPGPAELTRAGQALGIQTFTIGVRDSNYSAAVNARLKRLDTSLIEASPDDLSDSLARIWSALLRGYVVRYRSRTTLGSTVAVQATADGIPGTVHLSYTSPRPRPVPAPPPPPRLRLQALNGFSQLSAYPSFAAPLLAGASPAGHSFWTSPSSIAFVALVCALLVGLAVRFGFGAFSRSDVRARVRSFIDDVSGDPEEAEADLQAAETAPGLLARRRWWPAFVTDVEVARIRRSPMSLVRLTAVGSLLGGLLLSALIGTVAVVLVAVPLGTFLLVSVVRRRARRQRVRFAEQLPTYLQDMASAIRGGRSFVSAIISIADGADEPIRGEFERAVTDDQLGLPVEESLETIAKRMDSEDLEQLVLIAALHRQSGSNVAESIDRIAQGARERAELQRELKALTSQARLSSRVLTALPVFLLVGLTLIAPSYIRPMLHTTGGQVLLCILAVMVACGWKMMNRIVKVEG